MKAIKTSSLFVIFRFTASLFVKYTLVSMPLSKLYNGA